MLDCFCSLSGIIFWGVWSNDRRNYWNVVESAWRQKFSLTSATLIFFASPLWLALTSFRHPRDCTLRYMVHVFHLYSRWCHQYWWWNIFMGWKPITCSQEVSTINLLCFFVKEPITNHMIVKWWPVWEIENNSNTYPLFFVNAKQFS